MGKSAGAVDVEGATPNSKTFLFRLYRTVMFPNKLYEINAQNKPVLQSLQW